MMLTAEEARQQTNQILQSKAKEELKHIKDTINTYIKLGRDIAWFNGKISKEASTLLECLGYTVVQTEDRNESCYSVSWKADTTIKPYPTDNQLRDAWFGC